MQVDQEIGRGQVKVNLPEHRVIELDLRFDRIALVINGLGDVESRKHVRHQQPYR